MTFRKTKHFLMAASFCKSITMQNAAYNQQQRIRTVYLVCYTRSVRYVNPHKGTEIIITYNIYNTKSTSNASLAELFTDLWPTAIQHHTHFLLLM